MNLSRYRYVGIKLRVALRKLRLKPPRHQKVGICCIFQNDAAFLKEWIDFHLAIGVDHFFLYNNQSEDHFREVLLPYEKIGVVTLLESIEYPDFMEQVVKCYNHCLLHYARDYKWMAFLDSDEFIILKKTDSIKTFLRDYEDYPGVFMNWLLFGTSGVEHLTEDEFLIEKLLYRFPVEHNEHLHGKSIMQPASGMLFYSGNPHYPQYFPLSRLVYPDKTPFKPQKEDRKICIDQVQLNHYWYRTEDFYRDVKIPRRLAFEGKHRNPKLESWHRKMANSTYDGSALKFVGKLKKQSLEQ